MFRQILLANISSLPSRTDSLPIALVVVSKGDHVHVCLAPIPKWQCWNTGQETAHGGNATPGMKATIIYVD